MIRRIVPRTLRARLTVLIILSTSTVLAASGFALYEALRNRIESASLGQMAETMIALQTHLGGIEDTDDVQRHTELWVDQLHGHQSMDLAIYDATGKRLLSTPGYQPYAPVLSTPVPVRLERARPALRYLVTNAPLAAPKGMAVRVAVQYDPSEDLESLRESAHTIVIIEVLGVFAAAVLAYGTALFGLVPLRRLAARAEDMSTSRLAQPLPKLDASGELKELERAFNGMLARLDEAFTRLSQFSSNLAHDMRTPLTNLQAAAQVALAQPRSADEYRDVIESSVDEYQRLSRMIEDMLFLARSEQADAPLALRELDAVEEAERVAGYYETVAEDAGVSIVVSGRGSVSADLLLYQRALSNLVSNALAHAPAGSTIAIGCERQDDATTITVADSGRGIDAAHLERIFERYYRVDPSRHNSASGTGLGLAIVRSIMDSHGGQCGVRSWPHVRTEFWLRFPDRKEA